MKGLSEYAEQLRLNEAEGRQRIKEGRIAALELREVVEVRESNTIRATEMLGIFWPKETYNFYFVTKKKYPEPLRKQAWSVTKRGRTIHGFLLDEDPDIPIPVSLVLK